MKFTDESRGFYFAVYSITSNIPFGKVTSYAYLVGKPQNSRQVGTSMKLMSTIIQSLNSELDESEKFDINNLPWWRVVLSSGKISPRGDSGSELRQAEMLRQENVEVLESLVVSLDEFGWLPEDV